MNIVYIQKAKTMDEVLAKWQKRLPLSIKKRIVKGKVYFEKQGENVESKVFLFDKSEDKDLEKIGQNLKNTITTNEYKNVVISNELKKNAIIMDKLQGLNILNGNFACHFVSISSMLLAFCTYTIFILTPLKIFKHIYIYHYISIFYKYS